VLYVDLADRDDTLLVTPTVGPAVSRAFTRSDSMWISRVAINWKFGKDAIVAKY